MQPNNLLTDLNIRSVLVCYVSLSLSSACSLYQGSPQRSNPHNLYGMFLDCGGKLEHPEETHTDTE